MSEPGAREAQSGSGTTAGALLRQARQAQGLEIAALAAAIKVPQRKLELLEADRFDELHDATFARALAQTVCRTLRIDPAPVMALLPQPRGMGLDQLNQGLNTPFRDRSSSILTRDWSDLTKPVVWAPALIVLASVAIYLLPSNLVESPESVTRSEPISTPMTAASPVIPAATEGTPGNPQAPVVETVHTSPPQPESAAEAASAATGVSGLLQLRTSAQSWVEVLDAKGQLLLSRVIQPGEAVGLDGSLPLRVKIGNSAGTQLMFRGEVVELASHTRENVARLELK